MAVYLFLLIWLLISTIIERHTKRLGKIIYKFNLFVCFFLLAFRGFTVGTDTVNYQYIFNNLTYQDLRGIEYSWFYLMKFCTAAGGYRLFLIIISALTIYFIGSAISNLSRSHNFALYLFVSFYFYFASMNIMRQMLAVSICLYSTIYILNNKPFRFLTMVLLASSFHTTALCFLPFYLFAKMNFNKSVLIVFIVLSFVLAPYAVQLATHILGLSDTYSMYLYAQLNDDGGSSLVLLIYTLIALFLVIYTDTSNALLKIFVFGVFFINFFAAIPVISRLGFYYRIILICILSSPHIKAKKIIRELFYIILIFYTFASSIFMLSHNAEGVYPYFISFI